MKDPGRKSNFVYKEPHGNSCQNVWPHDRSSKQNQSFKPTQLYTKLYQIFTKLIFKPQLLFYSDKIPKACDLCCALSLYQWLQQPSRACKTVSRWKQTNAWDTFPAIPQLTPFRTKNGIVHSI